MLIFCHEFIAPTYTSSTDEDIKEKKMYINCTLNYGCLVWRLKY